MAPLNLQVATLTAESRERDRLDALWRGGHFSRPVFPVLESFVRCDPMPVVEEVRRYRARFDDLVAANRNPVGYSFDNNFFGSPDAEVLYALVRRHAPARIVEIGSGNSTKITRLAIMDGGLSSRLISIDPQPRAEIEHLCDESYRLPTEHPSAAGILKALGPGDLLFIDSSHMVTTGNDVVHLFLNVLPQIGQGVLLHIHDIFLPYEYPYEWLQGGLSYGEQYFVQLMLADAPRFEVLWPGHYLQKSHPNFQSWFDHLGGGRAQSLWLRSL